MTLHDRRSAATKRRLWALQTAALLMLAWVALDGIGNLWAGLVFTGLGVAAGTWLVPGEPYPWRPLRLLRFLGYFLRESLRGGVDVASRALRPSLPIAPHLFEHRLTLPPGMPRTVMVSVVSLLPGTLSVTIDADGRLLVHALASQGAEDVAELERRVAHLFSLDL